MDLSYLENIGLTKSEIKVYNSLLELGSSTTGPLVKKSGVSSSKIYIILDKLIEKGLVNYVLKGNVKYFESASPERILDYLSEKEKEIIRQREIVEKILPELIAKRESSKYKQEASIYRGFNGLHTVFYDALKSMKKGDTIYITGVPSRSKKSNLFFLKWNKYRASLGIRMKILFDESASGEPQTLSKNSPLSEIKYLPEGIATPAAINIYKDRTIIFPSETEKEPLLIVINSKEIADSFRSHFDILWNQQARVYTGIIGPKTVFREMAKSNNEILAFGIEGAKISELLPNELQALIEHQKLNKIRERLIFNKMSKNQPLSKYAKVKLLSGEYFSPLHIEIYDDNVGIIDWINPITTIIIKKKEISDAYRKYFNVLWKIAK